MQRLSSLILLLVFLAMALALPLHAAPSPPPARLDNLLKSGDEKLRRMDLGKAEETFNMALQLARESQDRAAQATAHRGLARTMIAVPEGEAEARFALAIHRSVRDAAGEVADLLALSENYQSRSYFSKASKALAEALVIERRLGLHSEEAQTLEQQASMQRFMGSYEEALATFAEALSILHKNGSPSYGEVRLATRLGQLNADLGRFKEAERYLKEAVASARRLTSQISPAAWAKLQEQARRQFAGFPETFLATAQSLAEQDDPTPNNSSDPELLRLTLEAYAEDREEQTGRFLALDRALTSLTIAFDPNAAPSAKRELEDAWEQWENWAQGGIAMITAQSKILDEAAMRRLWSTTEQDQILKAAAFNYAALRHWHLKTVPDGWYAQQARGLNALLHKAGDDAVLTVEQIASVDPESASKDSSFFTQWLSEWFDQVESGKKGTTHFYQQWAEGLAKQARLFRDVLASGKPDDQVMESLAAAAKSRRIIMGAMRAAFQGASKEQLLYQDAALSGACEAEALTTLGRIYRELGSPQEAKAKNDEAWDLLEKTSTLMSAGAFESNFRAARKLGLPIPTGTAGCGGIAFSETSLWSADLKTAEGHTKKAMEDYMTAAARSSALQPAAWQRIASLYAGIGANSDALNYYRKALDATEAIQGQLRRGELVASWASHQESLYAQAIRLLYDLKQPAEAFEYAERARARAFLNQIGNRRLPAVGVPLELGNAVQDVRQRLIELESRPQEGMGNRLMPNIADEEKALRKAYQDLLAAVTQANPEYASLLKVDTVTLAQAQGEILDDHTSLIEYFVLDDKLLAWVIDRKSVTWLALPISASELHDRIQYLRNLIASREPSREAAAALHAVVFAPLEPYLHNHDVIVVPQGPLHFLPFGALWNSERDRFVAEDYTLTLAPSASALRFVRHKLKPSTSGLLALGNPDGSLPHAEEEVRGITELFNATPRIGPEALESRLYREGSDARIVHLAAHATYDPQRPLFTHIDLAADQGAPAQDGKSDGKLNVYEIYGLDLKNANLVVLSACDTALSAHDEGDDLIGLPRAFLYAGAPAVLSTLWRVDDESTATLMQKFYKLVRQGMPAATALQAAQREILEQSAWKEPYFWAGFTLIGSRPTTDLPQ